MQFLLLTMILADAHHERQAMTLVCDGVPAIALLQRR
jgi:hypothetical protein